MMTLNAIGATWTVVVFIFIAFFCIRYRHIYEELPSFSQLGPYRKLLVFFICVALVGGSPWLLAVILFKTFVFGW